MMYVIAQKEEHEEVGRYWCGGDMWNVHVEEAAKFEAFGDALATIDLIGATGATIPTAHVVKILFHVEAD